MVHAAIAARDGWPEAPAARLEREAVARPALVNALLAEPDLGSAAQGGPSGTVATRVPGGWRISGRKAYVTGIPALSRLVIRARTEEETPRTGLFIAPAKAEGVTVIANWDHIGMRATHSHEVELRDVFVPEGDTNALTEADAKGGVGTVLMRWNIGLLGGLYDGIVRAALDWTVEFLKTRAPSSLGRPLATLPAMQDVIGRISLALDRNALLLSSYARAVAAGDETAASRGAPVIKTEVVDGAATLTLQLLTIAGNAGLSARNRLERCHRDALCGLIHAPHAELLRRLAGRRALTPGCDRLGSNEPQT